MRKVFLTGTKKQLDKALSFIKGETEDGEAVFLTGSVNHAYDRIDDTHANLIMTDAFYEAHKDSFKVYEIFPATPTRDWL